MLSQLSRSIDSRAASKTIGQMEMLSIAMYTAAAFH